MHGLIEPALIGALIGFLLHVAGRLLNSPETASGRQYEDAFDWEVSKPSPVTPMIVCAVIVSALSFVLH